MSKRSLADEKMSCIVMYQPYAISSSTSSSSSSTHPYTTNVCDRPPQKKSFRFPYVPSPPDSLHSDASSYSHSSPGPPTSTLTANTGGGGTTASPLGLSLNLNVSSTITSSSTPTGNERRPLTPSLGLGAASPYASATIISASPLQQQQSSSVQNLRSPQSISHGRGSSSSTSSTIPATITSHTHTLLDPENETEGNNDNEQDHQHHHHHNRNSRGNRVQYLSANCVVYENYQEETARAVEDHFNRALSAASTAKSTPMSTRKFPPSFWNSSYQPQSASASKPFVNMGGYSAGDFYGAMDHYGSTFTGLSHHQSDPWHYSLTSHQGYHHRASDLAYPPMPSTSRFNAAQYGSFFLAGAAATSTSAASRFTGGSQCGTNIKGDSSSWPTGLYHHPHDSFSELNLADYAATHYTNRTTGLETTAVGQETASKDAYWF